MEIPFQENYFLKRSPGVFYATKVSFAFFVNPSLWGFCKPLSQFCTLVGGSRLYYGLGSLHSRFFCVSPLKRVYLSGDFEISPPGWPVHWLSVIPSQSDFPQRVSLFLKASKTDAFRQGHALVIACSTSPVCAMTHSRLGGKTMGGEVRQEVVV